MPKSDQGDRQPKSDRNVERDARVQADLAPIGCGGTIVWKCEVTNAELLRSQVDKPNNITMDNTEQSRAKT